MDYMQREWRVSPDEIARFVHGTTVATNAVLERKGAKIGLITTAGFKDVLEIGRQMRHKMYDLVLEARDAGVPRAGRVAQGGARARRRATGEVLVAARRELGRARGRRAGRRGRRGDRGLLPVLVPQSGARAADARDHRRAPSASSWSRCPARSIRRSASTSAPCVTAFDAYIKPVVDRYLESMEQDLAAAGVAAPLQIMQSRGGISSSTDRPAAAGAALPVRPGGRRHRRPARSAARPAIDDLITVDIGGTSCDIALISRGTAADPRRRRDRRLFGARADGRCERDRRRAAAASPGSMPPAALRVGPALGGLGARPRLLRPRRRAGDGDRCLDRPRLHRSGLFRRRLAEARRRTSRARRSRRRSPRPLGLSRRAGGARHPSRPQRPDGRRRSGSSRSAAASIPRGSRCCRSAAAGRCMRPRWRANSASDASPCRRIPACCRRRACSSRRSSTRFRGLSAAARRPRLAGGANGRSPTSTRPAPG